jgi:beta-phosphoglucomutase-like phosphatase (HAD superfamily)
MSSVSPFDLVIFDCDGVLVDSEPLSCLAFEQVYANHGMKLPEGTVAKGIGMKQADIMKMIEDMTGHRLPEEATSQFWPETKILFAEALQPTVGIASFLRELPQKRCVASRSVWKRPVSATISAMRSIRPAWSSAASQRRTCSCSQPTKWVSIRRVAW